MIEYMLIEKKVWPEYFKLVKSGKKNFELRLADFKCKSGDVLFLREWNPKTKSYTGRSFKRKVGFVLKTRISENFYKKRDLKRYGLQVISFK